MISKESKEIKEEETEDDRFQELWDKANTFGGLEEDDPDIYVRMDELLFLSQKRRTFVNQEEIEEEKKNGKEFFIVELG